MKDIERISYLCALVDQAGGEVYQKQKFLNGVYALNNSRDRKDDEQIFDYEFEGLATGGMTDKQLMEDIVSMEFLGLVKIKRDKRGDDKLEHDLIKITDKGMFEAAKAIRKLPYTKIKRIKEVAEDLKVLSNNEILNKYGKEWQEWALKELA